MRLLTDHPELYEGCWDGRRAFVIGSGPSMKGFDLNLLRKELTIGCNEEYLWGPTIGLAQDPRITQGDGIPGRVPLFKNPAWLRGDHVPVYFHGHPDVPLPADVPDEVYRVNSAHSKDRPFRWGQSLQEGLYYGANVGMAAINLAEILGADPIYLLGFDARWEDSSTHHHGKYPKEWTLDKEVDRKAVYGRWIKEFRKIAALVRARVINLNPDSAVDAFSIRAINVLETAGCGRIVVG